MRYENWDVLLFSQGSKVPVQEFKTQCFVTRDQSPYLQAQAFTSPGLFFPVNGLYGGPGQVPVLTSFIPSLPPDSPFRVSIHSWEKPRPSRILESIMQLDDAVVYEARVFIDGSCVSGSLFNERGSLPHVIDLSSQLDKNGDQDYLRFPHFHEEILRHTHWDAGEMYGRVRIVLAEGLARPNRSPPFERVRDVIIFTFQHAPLNILEHSSIAWPNPGMWLNGPRPFLQYSLGNEKAILKDEDAHSHSPNRHEGRPAINTGARGAIVPYRYQPTAVPWQHNSWSEGDPAWVAPTPPILDPFFDPYRLRGHTRSVLDDVSMPDYVNSSTSSSRAISTNISHGRNQEPSAPAPIDDEQYNQLIEALSPTKAASGTCAPVNTPVSTAAKKPKCSPATERPRKESRPGPLIELSQPGSRIASCSSGAMSEISSVGKIPSRLLSPSPNAISRERSVSPAPSSDGSLSSGTHLKPTLPIPMSNESKRKRSPRSARKSIDSTRSLSPTPSKKVSRRKEKEHHSKESSADLTVARALRAARSSISDVE